MRRGFTLIELLIVIAIIAILALIAIPNFLEAQTRSRVSRCYSDMRSLALAVEAYTVDYQTWPHQWTINAVKYNIPPEALTTPMAYITQLPKDPFTLLGGGLNKKGSVHEGKNFEFDSADPAKDKDADLLGAGFHWWFDSWGPSRNIQQPGNAGQNVNIPDVLTDKNGLGNYVYDPTNGSVSRGYILWTNKGLFKGPDRK